MLYYGFGGGLGHITRFRAFCYTQKISPKLITAKEDVANGKIQTMAEKVLIPPREAFSNKTLLKSWVQQQLLIEKPSKLIIDAFPGGILGELCDLPELMNIEIEYIARILKLETYLKRINGYLPHITRIWQVEKVSSEQEAWLNDLAKENNAEILPLDLKYPSSNADSHIELPPNTWLIVHSGSEDELLQLWEYANETALIEEISPNFVVVGQCQRPLFLPNSVVYYSLYPVTSLLEKATKVVSAAGFNIMQQMKSMGEKHLVLPFPRPLDDQYQRI